MKIAMNAPLERKIRKFNPGVFQKHEEVIEQFVVRHHELRTAMETLRGNIDAPSCQHLLIIAPRGRGKTMLLARTAAEIRTSSELSQKLLPVRFMEESHEIFNMGDFWLETLFHLAREIDSSNASLAQELRASHSDLTQQWRGGDLEERALSTVLKTADELDRQLVLMVENLQAMNNAVDDLFGWKLRKVLQTEPQIMLLATATTRFKGLDDVEQPFFELFRTIFLDPLDTEESRCLWQMATGDEMGGRAIRPLEILTGGDPRLLIATAQFARHLPMRALLENIVSLVDDHTEYFRAHLEGFAKTERRVYLAVIDLWQPSTANEIAARARMDIRTTSSLLGRLIDRGAIAADGKGKMRRYTAVQRLYSIYYKMRHEQGSPTVINHLIAFMIEFYSTAELVDALKTPIEAADTCIDKWRALWSKVACFLNQHKINLAVDTFRDLYSLFDPTSHGMLKGMTSGVIQLVTNGMPECEIIDILTIDQEKSDALTPLIAALRQRQGEEVNCAAEIRAVADDVLKVIESGSEGRRYLLNSPWLI